MAFIIISFNFSKKPEETKEDTVSSTIDSDKNKSDVVTSTNDQNTPVDDVLDHKIAESLPNGETSESNVCIVFV